MSGATIRVLLRSARETRALGRALGRAAGPGTVLALSGPLGAGKTTLVQGFAQGLGVPASEKVRSPTFALVDEHRGRLIFHHIDFYRLSEPDELDELGVRELLGGEGAAAVEWADLFPGELPEGAWWVRLSYAPGGGRIAEISGPDGGWREAVERLRLPAGEPEEAPPGGHPREEA